MRASHHPDKFLSWPRTPLGETSAWLGLLAVALVIANLLTATDGSQAGLLQLEAVLIFVTAPVALATAIIAAFRDHERSILVWMPIVVGVAFLVFMFVELTFPHA